MDHLNQDPVGRLVQDLCIRLLFDHLNQDPFQAPLEQTLWDLCISILLDHLYRDPGFLEAPVGPFFGPLVSGSCIGTCAKSLYHLCLRILLDHLYQDPTGPLAQDLVSGCFRTACVSILWEHLCKISVSASCGTTCANS